MNQVIYKPRISVDFDGVIYNRPKTERGNLVYSAAPNPGAMNFIRHAVSAFEVVICSSRFAGSDGEASQALCEVWFEKQLREERRLQVLRKKPPFDVNTVMSRLTFTATKPVARVYIDDRSFLFTGEWPTIPQLLAFRTWKGL